MFDRLPRVLCLAAAASVLAPFATAGGTLAPGVTLPATMSFRMPSAAGITIVAFWLVFPSAKKQTLASYREFHDHIIAGRRALSSALEQARETADKKTLEIVRHKDELIGQAKQEFFASTKKIETEKKDKIKATSEEFPERRNTAERMRNEKLAETSSKMTIFNGNSPCEKN